jgi:hypothetical protein
VLPLKSAAVGVLTAVGAGLRKVLHTVNEMAVVRQAYDAAFIAGMLC